MKISRGCLVSLKVRMFSAQGELLEDSGTRPLVYMHGADDIFARIEAALEGQETGFSTALHLEPEEAFGDDDASLLHLVPVKGLPQDVDIGMRFEGVPGQPADGRIYTVVDLTDDVAVLDGNHPLAGRALRFEVEVLGVEPAGEAALDESGRARVPDFLHVTGGPGSLDRAADDSGVRH
jgi:FKBP-type peptidyl-prolyl cis-trans isomerase SlyD